MARYITNSSQIKIISSILYLQLLLIVGLTEMMWYFVVYALHLLDYLIEVLLNGFDDFERYLISCAE